MSSPTFFKSLATGSINYLFGSYSTKFLVFINSIIILSGAGVYSYGVYKLAFSVYLMAGGLLLPGLNGLVSNDAIFYNVHDQRETSLRLLREFIFVKILVGVCAFFIFYFFAKFFAQNYSLESANYIRIVSWLFLINTISTISETLLNFRGDFFGLAVMGSVGELAKLFFFGYFLFYGANELSAATLLWVSVFGALASAAFILGYTLHYYGISFVFGSKSALRRSPLWSIIRAHGKWGLVKNYFSSLTGGLRLFLIKLFISTEAVAVYSVAASLASAVKKMVPTDTINVLVPRHFSRSREWTIMYHRATKYFVWAFTASVLVAMLVVPSLVEWAFPKYTSSVPYFRPLVLIVLANAMALNKQLIFSMRKQKWLFLLSVVEVGLILILSPVLIRKFGIYGVILETAITEFCIAFLLMNYLFTQRPELRFQLATLFTFDAEDYRLVGGLLSRVRSKLFSGLSKK